MKIQNEYLRLYLDYVEDTESPRIFHIWAAISGIGATLGRKAWMPFGTQRLFPNMYVLLVGPPAVRKSTAMNIMYKRLKASTALRFAPDDTGGQRQGLIRSMENADPEENVKGGKVKPDILSGLVADELVLTDKMDILRNTPLQLSDPRDKHVIMACQSEFASLVGHPDIPFLTFLSKVYDGEDYKYVLKKEESELHEPLLSILACTQPDTLAQILPQAALGQGFMSRIIFVFGNKKYKFLELPRSLPKGKERRIDELLSHLFNKFEGEFTTSSAAQELFSKAYKSGTSINDPRFIYYAERRDSHLRKMCMALAASRRSLEISAEDVSDALYILAETEKLMPEALGEFGMSPLGVAKQKILDFLRAMNEPITSDILWQIMSKDVRKSDFIQIINDLRNAKKIHQFTNAAGRVILTAVDINEKTENLAARTVLEGLIEDDEDGIAPTKDNRVH